MTDRRPKLGWLEPLGCRIGLYTPANEVVDAVLFLPCGARWVALFCQPVYAVPSSPAQGLPNIVGIPPLYYSRFFFSKLCAVAHLGDWIDCS